MSCRIPYESLEETLISAYKSNFNKYKDLTSIIEDVLNLPTSVKDEAKIHAIWYYAGYVNQLANNIIQLQTPEWSQGKYKSLHDYLTPFLSGEETFNYANLIEDVKSYFAKDIVLEEPEDLQDTILDMIDDIGKIDDSSLGTAVDEVINNILSNIQQLDTAILNPENTESIGLLRSLLNKLSTRKKTSANYTAINKVGMVISGLIERNNIAADYINMADAEGIGMYKGGNLFIVRKLDGTLYEAYFDTAKNKVCHYAPGTDIHETAIDREPGDQMVTASQVRDNDRFVNPQNYKLRLHVDEVLTGLVLQETVTAKKEKTMEEKLSELAAKGMAFYGGIKITASTKRQQLNAERRSRIRINYSNTGRQYETNERPNQSRYLQNGGDVILTTYKPTEGVTITVSNADGNISFELGSYTNLAFLRSDNSVEPVDLNNPQHVELLKQLAEVDSVEYREQRYEPITDEDIKALRDSFNRHKAFEKEVLAALNSEGEADIKDIFFRYYDLVNNSVSINYTTSNKIEDVLSNFVDSHDGELNLKVQNYDEDGNPVGQPENSKAAVIMRKERGSWIIENTIEPNQKIVAPSGKMYNTLEAYIQNEVIENEFANNKINLREWVESRFSQLNSVYISLEVVGNKLKPIAVPLVYQKQVQSHTDLFSLVGSMMHTFNEARMEQDNTATRDFNNDAWGFNIQRSNGIRPEIVLLKQSGGKKVFGIKFTMLNDVEGQNTEERKEAFNAFAKKHLTIPFNSDILNRLNTALQKAFEAAGIEQEENLSLASYNKLAVTAARRLGSDHPAVRELQEAFKALTNQVRTEFAKVKNNHDTLLAEGEISVPMIDENFRNFSLFNDEGELKLFNRKNRTDNILSAYRKLETTQESKLTLTYRNPLKKIILSPKKREIIVEKEVSPEAPIIPVDHSTEPVDPATVPENTEEVGDLNEITVNQDNSDPFMLTQAIEAFITLSPEKFAKEIEAMKALLPDAFQFTPEGFENLDVDGYALGYVKDLMIHLNNNLRAKGVAFHEGFHAVFRKLLTGKQREFYLKRVGKVLGNYKTDEKGKYILVNGEKVYANEFRERRRYGHLNDEQIRNLIYEEYLADSFADYMETKKVPHSWMGKLFEFLKSILRSFTAKGRLENLYYDIAAGKFKNESIKEYKSNVESVFSIYRGVPTGILDRNNKEIVENPEVQSNVVSEVSNLMVYQMAALAAKYPTLAATDPSLIFDQAKDAVLKHYQIEDLINQAPDMADEIEKTYGVHYANARWLLGQFHLTNEPFKFVNLTGLDKFDNNVVNKSSESGKAQLQRSKESADKFKQDVINEFLTLEFFDEEDDIQDTINKEEEENNKNEEVGESFTERSAIGLPPGNGTSAFRKLFKYIPFEQVDPRFGIKRTRTVDSNLIFSTIRKVTCNLPKDKVVFHLKKELDRLNLEVDQYNNEIRPRIGDKAFFRLEDATKTMMLRDSIKAVYDTLNEQVGLYEVIDSATKEVVGILPEKNHKVYLEFANVFNTVDVSLSQVTVETTEEWDDEAKEIVITEQQYRMSDIVIERDKNSIRQTLKNKITTINISQEEFDEVDKVLKAIGVLYGNKQSLMDKFLPEGAAHVNDAVLREYINDVYVALSKLNLNIPYSVVQINLTFNLWKQLDYKSGIFNKQSPFYSLLASNYAYWDKFQKFDYTFFSKRIGDAVNASLKVKSETDTGRRTGDLDNILKIVSSIYANSVGEFILKYDPTISGAVTRNANGDMISKYCKPTPAFVIALKLKSKENMTEGMKSVIDEFFSGFENYFEDNPLLNAKTDEGQAFLKNFEITSFAGFQHRTNYNGKVKMGNPSTFKDIDDKAFALALMGLFANKRKVTTADGKEMALFKRVLTIYETTSTSVVVDGVYKNYVDSDGQLKRGANEQLKLTDVRLSTLELLKVIKQEYNLIMKNHAEFGSSTVKKFLDYNVTLEDRGFKFNILSDFINANEEIGEYLRDAARDQIPFDSLISQNPESAKMITAALDEYTNQQFGEFIKMVSELGIEATDLPFQEDSEGSQTDFMKEFFLNTWFNAIFGNQLFDGPIATGVSSYANYFKRQKAGAAAGDNIFNPITGEKYYRAAMIPTVIGYLDDNDLTKPLQLTPHLDENGKPLASNVKKEIFDGQSFNHINRIVKISESQGKLDYDLTSDLKKLRYLTVSSKEYSQIIKRLSDNGVIFNSLKTVSASPMFYIKQSEHTLLRKDVSMLRSEYRTKEQRLQAEAELNELYNLADAYAWNVENGITDINPETQQVYNYEEMYREVMARIHYYFEPLKGQELRHNLLNSMEMHRIDQLMDPTASKKTKVDTSPIRFVENYLNLNDSVFYVPNELTYLQVSTSKIAEEVTQGIQQKLLVISGLDPESEEYKSIKKDIEGYHQGLADAVTSQLNKIKRLFNSDNKKVVGAIYTNIAAQLRAQGASPADLQYYELDNDGNPKRDPNLPINAEKLVYYFFSIFNKGLFDKKIEGRKYYHISSFGRKLIIGNNGQVITQDEYRKNPEKYANATTRYPSFTKEEVIDPKTGETITKYVAEVIVPKELSNLDQSFLEEYLSKFFATRIPTEGRRSMVVCKVVDYMDEAYGNGIIVPHQIHLLSGSDFDIDALYAHVKSSYVTSDRQRIPYGNYKHYMIEYGMSLKEAKFLEYLHYIINDQGIKELVDLEMEKIEKQTGYTEQQAELFGKHFRGGIQTYFEKSKKLLKKKEAEESEEGQENLEYTKTLKKLIATFNVLQTLKDSSLPSTPNELQEYTDSTGATPVTDVIFNKILEHKINILSNETVFEESMQSTINRADTAIKPFAECVKSKGSDEKVLYNKQNLYTPTAFLVARSLNVEGKDSLGISASFNKGISMLSSIDAELTEFYANGRLFSAKTKQKLSTGYIIADGVTKVGAAIGMFADAASNPYPGPLHLNTITTPVMCAMIATGFDQKAGIMFQSLPEIVQAVKAYNTTYGSSYNTDLFKRDKSFKKFLNERLASFFDDENFRKMMIDNGILQKNKKDEYVFVRSSYKLMWDEEKITPGKTIESNGFEIVKANGDALDERVKEFISLYEFAQYHEIANQISFKVTRLTDAMKGLKPNFDSFDRLLKTYDERGGGKGSVFTQETYMELFDKYPVLSASEQSIDYMDKISKKMFLDRTTLVKGLVNMFAYLRGYDTIQLSKDIKAYIALELQRKAAENVIPSSLFPDVYLELLNAETFLLGAYDKQGNVVASVIDDYNYLKSKYPDNAFIKNLTIRHEGNASNNVRVLEMVSSSLGKEQKTQAHGDFLALLRGSSDIRERAFRIAYYGMIKSGAMKAKGGYFELIPAGLSDKMSQSLTQMREGLVKLDEKMKIISLIKLNAVDNLSPEELQKLESDYFDQVNEFLNKNFNGIKIDELITGLIGKISSIYYESSSETDYKRSLKISKLLRENKTLTLPDVVNTIRRITRDYANNIIDEKGNRPLLDIKISTNYAVSSRDEIELFTPTDSKLVLSLSNNMTPTERTIISKFGITPSDNNQFIFPPFRKNIYGQVLVLKKIDGKPIGKTFAASTFGVDDMSYNQGLSAEYEVVGAQGSSRISPLAFNLEEGAKIKNITSTRVQQLSSKATSVIPNNMKVVAGTERLYQVVKANSNPEYHNNKSLTLPNGTVVKTTDDFNSLKYLPASGKLFILNKDSGKGELFEHNLDIVAQLLGRASWEEMKNDPEFEGFFKGVNKIVVYKTGEAKAPITQPAPESSTEFGQSLTQEQEDFAKQNKIEQNFYDKKPYVKETDAAGKVTKWGVYKSKNGKSSMQAALDGDRTETTRSVSEIQKLEKLAKNQGITNGITGTIVWMEGQVDNVKNSTNIKGDWFRITSEPYTPNQKDFDAYENWEPNVWIDRSGDFRIGEPGEWKSIRFERVSKAPVKTETVTETGFQGYKGGFDSAGKGTPEGDGKDKAMRKVATSSIVEIKSAKKASSSMTTLESVGTDNDYSYEKDRYVGSSYNGTLPAFSGIGVMNNFGTTVMLARNAELKNLALSDETKRLIKIANQQGAEFVVGDMPEVDSQFIDYLQEIGAKFTVYHTGDTSRIEVKPTEPVKTEFKLSTPTAPIKIYSDGSDIKGTGRIGFGAVYEYNGTMYGLSGTEEGDDVKQLKQRFPDAEFSNPTMEMLALVKTLESFSGTAEHLSIFQDYKGAVNYNELWNYSEGSAQREAKPWNAKQVYIKHLVDRAVQAIKQIESNGGSVKINWVKGHSGNKMNDAADMYAKSRDNMNDLTKPLSDYHQSEIEKIKKDKGCQG